MKLKRLKLNQQLSKLRNAVVLNSPQMKNVLGGYGGYGGSDCDWQVWECNCDGNVQSVVVCFPVPGNEICERFGICGCHSFHCTFIGHC